VTTPELRKILDRNEHADLLRLTTAGGVDDGKSTLIGRLLHDSKAIFEDQMVSVTADSKRLNREVVDLALLTDGLKAEREEGITIDVAYRYFSTPRRRFIIADTPGHEQYTRNMVTGASTADLSLILVDAQRGLTTQSKRHGFIAALLRTPHVLVLVNKMDLVDWSQDRFNEIREEYEAFAQKLEMTNLSFLPICALTGDNVVHRSEHMDWFGGSPLMSQLETVYVAGNRNLIDLRLPVQFVNRPSSTFRGYCGTLNSGVIRRGDEIMVMPSGRTTQVERIVTQDGDLDFAFASQSVTLTLADEVNVSRGDMIVHPGNQPQVERQAEAMLVWMDETPLKVGATYLFRHTSKETKGTVSQLRFRVDPNDLHRAPAEKLGLNEIGRVQIDLHVPLMMDPYERNRSTGAFVMIDPLTHHTVAAGMIRRPGRPALVDPGEPDPASRNIFHHRGAVSAAERSKVLGGQQSATLWFTGLSGSGKSTLAFAVEKELLRLGCASYVLDGDNVRHGLNRDLGFAPAERTENIRRIAEVAHLMNDAGLIVIAAFIAPYRVDRHRAREVVGDAFFEVFVDAPIEVCEERDPKGLYAKARRGEISDFTGISAPYEQPENPDVHLKTDQMSPEEAAREVVRKLQERGIVPGQRDA
jgi:bifunctional enzyme CysN/CysC